jgi:hypothetical protein
VAAADATECVLRTIGDELLSGEPYEPIAVDGDLARRPAAGGLPTKRAVAHADLRMPTYDLELDSLTQAAAFNHVASPFFDPIVCTFFACARFTYWWGHFIGDILGRAPGVQLTFTLNISSLTLVVVRFVSFLIR